MESPNYYAIIPAFVRYSDIIASAKLLYGEITALSNKKGYCYATNGYFASLYHVDNSQIKRWIKSLSDAGFITVEANIELGNTRCIRISENAPTLGAKMPLPSGRKCPYPRGENAPHNNTLNNTLNNKDIIILIDEEEKKEQNFNFHENRKLEKNILILKENETIDNIDDLRKYLNKGKLQEEFFYKIGTEDTFDRLTSDFFIFCDENHREMKKKTIEAKFRAYLKPKWESEEDRNEMILNYRRRIGKKKYTEDEVDTTKDREENEDMEKKIREREMIEVIEKEGIIPEEERKILFEESEKECRFFLKGKIINQKSFALMVKSMYFRKILNYKEKEMSI